jgi:transcriptional regulator GlxA family with amidase domain
VAKAQEHLQFTTRSVDRVALDVGYNDPGAFRKVFARIVGLTPGEYRKRFRS